VSGSLLDACRIGIIISAHSCEDGGSVRGLSSLVLVAEVMSRLRELEGSDRPLNPADYFDVIAGTGTGG
jgi:patatin-like phospholipase/acyl hydrolase